ncbi:hypothetical protein RHOER0001_5460 [Rhodococcus erythropolis SK121]|nr:hypothetical protein RHOER0001_5460 [Rhodococcus erythropolis SK121]
MAAVSPAMSPLTTNIAVEEAGAPLCCVDSGGESVGARSGVAIPQG